MAKGKSATVNYKLFYEETHPRIELWEEIIAKQEEVIRKQDTLIRQLESAGRTQDLLIASLEAYNTKLESDNAELESEVENWAQELDQLKKMIINLQSERSLTSDAKTIQSPKEHD